VLLDLQVLARIALAESATTSSASTGDQASNEEQDLQFQLVLNAILKLFAQDRHLLETRGPLIIRKLCVLLNAKTVYLRMAQALVGYEINPEAEDYYHKLQFIGTMVQTLNLILLTASELHDLRGILSHSFEDHEEPQIEVFTTLFECWCHNPVSTYSLCLLAKAYDLSFALVQRFSDMPDISVGFLMQIDKLVHLLESPIFIHLRLQLLNVDAPYHSHLLKSIYGLLMCLPQGDAFRLLNERLSTVCNLRDNLNLSQSRKAIETAVDPIVNKYGLKMGILLNRFDRVLEMHHEARDKAGQNQAAALAANDNPSGHGPTAVAQEIPTPTRFTKPATAPLRNDQR
jgi:vacuole morphology and inheritance protein 14